MIFAQILTGFGLAGAAGLNAFIPLFLVAVLGRFGVITLAAPFDVLTHTAVIVTLALLLLVELVVDKVPVLDHANDVIMTVVRPAAGALLFAGASGAITDLPAWALVVAGLVTALGVHTTKAAVRPVTNLASAGFAAPIVSVLENVFSAVLSAVAIFLPVFVILLLGLFAFVAVKLWRRVRGPRAA